MARGSIKARKNAAGQVTSWRVVYDVPAPDGSRKQKVESARTRKDAEKLLTKRLAEIAGGTYVVPSTETVGEFLRRWHEVRSPGWPRASTREHLMETIERRIEPGLGTVRLQRLTTLDVERWVGAMAGRYARSTVAHALSLLRRALRDAVRWGEVVRNVAEGVKPVGKPPKRKRALTAVEAGKLIASAKDEYERALWWLLLDSGLRVGEALALRWADVDLRAGVVTVRRTLSGKRAAYGGYVEVEGGKSAGSARDAAIGAETAAALRSHKAAQNGLRLRTGGLWVDEDRVFPNTRGGRLNPCMVREWLLDGCARAGLEPITIHELRHTMTTLAIEAGAELKAVQATLGHRNVTMTLGVYAHARDEQRKAAAELVEAVILGGRDQAVTTGQGEVEKSAGASGF